MARPKGLAKTGGRKAGTPNGKSIAKAAEHLESVKVTVARVLEEYGRIAFLDIGTAFDSEGRLLPIHQMPEDVRRSLGGIEVVSYEEDNDGKGSIGKLHKIKIIDKRAALADVAKHLGMFIDRIGGPNGEALQMTDIRVHFVKASDGKPVEG